MNQQIVHLDNTNKSVEIWQKSDTRQDMWKIHKYWKLNWCWHVLEGCWRSQRAGWCIELGGHGGIIKLSVALPVPLPASPPPFTYPSSSTPPPLYLRPQPNPVQCRLQVTLPPPIISIATHIENCTIPSTVHPLTSAWLCPSPPVTGSCHHYYVNDDHPILTISQWFWSW